MTQEHQIEDALLQINDYHEAVEFVKHISMYVLFDENDDYTTDWVHAVDRYIRAHYRDNFTLGQLAEQFDLNPAYLSRVFKKMKSVSPLDLLIELKIEEAKRLIQANPRSLFKDVAFQLGYEDAFHFSKLFKKWTGVTPTEYKNGVIHASSSIEQTQS
ncbi:HTH-type transcriptional activator Btr [compost metagenome]